MMGGGGNDVGRNEAHIQHPPIKTLVPLPWVRVENIVKNRIQLVSST